MSKFIKKMSMPAILISITFLLIQVICDLYIPTLTAGMVNKGIVAGNTTFIWYQGSIMLLVTIISFLSAVINTRISAKIAYKLGNTIRYDIFNKILKFSNEEVNQLGTSSLITRNTNDVNQVQNLVEMGLKFLILAPLYLIGGIIMSYRLSPQLSTVFLVVTPIIAIIAIGLSVYSNPLYSIAQKLIDKLNLIFKEGLSGVKVIRAFNKEEHEYIRYKKANDEYTKTSIKVNAIIGLLMPIMTLILNGATLIITFIGGSSLSNGSMEIGTIMGVINYAMQILTGFMLLTNVISSIPRGITSANRINEVLDYPLAINNPKNPKKFGNDEAKLSFDSVYFNYAGAEKNALENISFDLKKGETLAIIGSTGSGKSSLIQLIPRFYDVQKGNIYVNGLNVKNVLQEELQKKISYVPQKSTLFFGTIRDNMTLGHQDITDTQIWEALDIAQATEFIKDLPEGLDSIVEKSGGNFSGGQKQRLSIARAILKKADIYVFDDSFSALDFKTDSLIRNAMKDKLSNAITVIVAQRVSTIMNADQIAVLDNGKLVGLGTHDYLSSKNSIYQEILNSQSEKGRISL